MTSQKEHRKWDDANLGVILGVLGARNEAVSQRNDKADREGAREQRNDDALPNAEALRAQRERRRAAKDAVRASRCHALRCVRTAVDAKECSNTDTPTLKLVHCGACAKEWCCAGEL